MADTADDFDDVFSKDSEADGAPEAVADEGEQDEAILGADEIPQRPDEPDTAPPAVEDDAVSGRIAAVLAERDKRQAAEKRADELEARLNQYQQSQNRPAPKQHIDPIDDPQGFQAQLEETRIADRIEMSEDMARMQHGDALVTEAQTWAQEQAQSNPVMMAQIRALGQQRNPYGTLINLYKQAQALAEVGTDLDAYKVRLRAEWEAESAVAPAGVAPVAKPQARAVPPSLAKGGGTLGDVSETDDDAFASVFQ
jgi:hypothetical protein